MIIFYTLYYLWNLDVDSDGYFDDDKDELKAAWETVDSCVSEWCHGKSEVWPILWSEIIKDQLDVEVKDKVEELRCRCRRGLLVKY